MSKLNKIDAAIRGYYQKKNLPVSGDLITAILYSVDSGGKRIRPLIFLDLLEGFGLELTPSHFNVAASLEMIHTGSLIHDDLPAMDNDDYRRGRLTNHKVYGAGMATQAGDGLLTFAFQLLSEQKQIAPDIRVELISLLARAAGPEGMVGGQAHDIEAEGKHLTLSELKILDACKTGCLLSAPVSMACAVAGTALKDRVLLENFAAHLGLLFQITDDLLDEKGNLEDMGKMPGQDEKDHKSTFVTILGVEEAEKYAEEEGILAKEALAKLPFDSTILYELTDLLLHRKK